MFAVSFFSLAANGWNMLWSGFRRAFMSDRTEQWCENPQLLTAPTPL